jgi:hypothetical protein
VDAILSGLLADYGLAVPVAGLRCWMISAVADTFVSSLCRRGQDHDSLPQRNKRGFAHRKGVNAWAIDLGILCGGTCCLLVLDTSC